MAAERCPEAVLYNVRDEVKRPSGAYDMILVANVFHHIPPHLRQAQMAQVSGLLKAGGDLFFFEHNPFNPVTRRIVSTCPMDRDAELIRPRVASDLIRSAGLRVTTKRYTLFFPAALRVLRSLENRMWWLPLGGQYFLKAVK